MNDQLIAQMGVQLGALGRQMANLGVILNEQKARVEMLSRMLSMHHFAILAIVASTPPEDPLRETIKQIAKRFKIKLNPTDPDYGNERSPS